jgi:hypothetical protein
MGEKGRKEISKIKRGSPNLSTLSAPLEGFEGLEPAVV